MFNPSASPTQGISQHAFAISPTSPTSTRGFKRSASSDDDQENGDGDTRPSSRRNTAVKRACNECRQQKVSLLVFDMPVRGRKKLLCGCIAPTAVSRPTTTGRIEAHRIACARALNSRKGNLSNTPLTPASSSSATSSKTPS
jgi:hypothetical protein